ncbi:hypothetical protein [Streptomyces sp. NRRL S-813]|uniref:hypothetical protein n=1 Tax=Streptomyces sp. NRRL S-813 TaxID=1463919 RepID=UPI00131BE068|nr:hypothetical protein [Streptomyces sp. NRRL S-813]
MAVAQVRAVHAGHRRRHGEPTPEGSCELQLPGATAAVTGNGLTACPGRPPQRSLPAAFTYAIRAEPGLSFSIRLAPEVCTGAERPSLLSCLSSGVLCVFHGGVACGARPYGRGTAHIPAGGRHGALIVWVDVLGTSKSNGVESGGRQKEHRDRKKDGHVRQ